MRYKAQSLTLVLACLAAAGGTLLAMKALHAPGSFEFAGFVAADDGDSGAAQDSAAHDPVHAPQAERLLRQAVATLEALPSVRATVRQRVDMLGHQFRGAGTYLQQRIDAKRNALISTQPQPACRFRLEFKYQVEDRTASVLAIGNDQAVWTYTKLLDDDGGYSARLEKISVPEVLSAIARRQGRPKPDSFGFTSLAVGGLPQLLDGLSSNYDFNEPRKANIGGVPLWEVRGRIGSRAAAQLDPKQRAELKGGGELDYASLPPHVPGEVAVWLGQDDLFPYRVVFLRIGDGPPREMAVVEFYEVDFRGRLEARQFDYDPGTKKYTDVTKAYLAHRGLK